MQLDTIHHAGLAVSDFNGAVTWWKANFGLKLISKWRDDHLQMGMVGLGDVRIELFCLEGVTTTPEAKDPTPKSMSRPGWNHVAIKIRDLDAALEDLRKAGVTILAERAEAPMNYAYAYICDPSGNRIELLELHAAKV